MKTHLNTTLTVKYNRFMKRKQYPWYFPYLLISPFFLGFTVFQLAPIVYSFYISLTKWSGFNTPQFIGFGNYRDIIHDELFYTALFNTVKISVIFIFFLIVLSVITAYLLHMGFIRGKKLFQTIYFLPYITTPVAIGFLFHALFDGDIGFVNHLLLQLGIIKEGIDFLFIPGFTAPLISLTIIWSTFGYCVILVMAGLQGIAKEVNEAAIIDGANGFQLFWKITVPLIRPILTFLVITLLISGLQLFDETYLFYGPTGGPDFSGLTLVSYLFTTAFVDRHFGYGASVAYGLSIIIMVFTLSTLRLMRGRS